MGKGTQRARGRRDRPPSRRSRTLKHSAALLACFETLLQIAGFFDVGPAIKLAASILSIVGLCAAVPPFREDCERLISRCLRPEAARVLAKPLLHSLALTMAFISGFATCHVVSSSSTTGVAWDSPVFHKAEDRAHATQEYELLSRELESEERRLAAAQERLAAAQERLATTENELRALDPLTEQGWLSHRLLTPRDIESLLSQPTDPRIRSLSLLMHRSTFVRGLTISIA